MVYWRLGHQKTASMSKPTKYHPKKNKKKNLTHTISLYSRTRTGRAADPYPEITARMSIPSTTRRIVCIIVGIKRTFQIHTDGFHHFFIDGVNRYYIFSKLFEHLFFTKFQRAICNVSTQFSSDNKR